MSGPFKADAKDIRALADFLDRLSDLTNNTGVSVCAYGPEHVELPGGATVQIAITREDPDVARYVVDDRIGD
jgi:hypothetical protein